eukprot:c10710_g1_i2.p1 GENE.c10710_g1_i2~~c10710_g1_i2.p1  ORF type:complete len:280 (+),score=76.56 c10710_g1_i2:42-842(+)
MGGSSSKQPRRSQPSKSHDHRNSATNQQQHHHQQSQQRHQHPESQMPKVTQAQVLALEHRIVELERHLEHAQLQKEAQASGLTEKDVQQLIAEAVERERVRFLGVKQQPAPATKNDSRPKSSTYQQAPVSAVPLESPRYTKILDDQAADHRKEAQQLETLINNEQKLRQAAEASLQAYVQNKASGVEGTEEAMKKKYDDALLREQQLQAKIKEIQRASASLDRRSQVSHHTRTTHCCNNLKCLMLRHDCYCNEYDHILVFMMCECE